MFDIYRDGKPLDICVNSSDIHQAYDVIVRTFITGDLLKLVSFKAGLIIVDYVNPDEQHVYELVEKK
jgi:hypothetical protein